MAGRALGIGVAVVPAELNDTWWRIPVLIAVAFANGWAEEIIVVAFLMTRLRQLGLSPRTTPLLSSLLRGAYHLYQGFGAGLGNVAMGSGIRLRMAADGPTLAADRRARPHRHRRLRRLFTGRWSPSLAALCGRALRVNDYRPPIGGPDPRRPGPGREPSQVIRRDADPSATATPNAAAAAAIPPPPPRTASTPASARRRHVGRRRRSPPRPGPAQPRRQAPGTPRHVARGDLPCSLVLGSRRRRLDRDEPAPDPRPRRLPRSARSGQGHHLATGRFRQPPEPQPRPADRTRDRRRHRKR